MHINNEVGFFMNLNVEYISICSLIRFYRYYILLFVLFREVVDIHIFFV